MGIGPAARDLYRKLGLKPPARVCDLGSQEMSQGLGGSAKDWMEHQGFEYTSIDFDGKFGALKLDLNEITAHDLYEMHVNTNFDIVTNHGTTEHIFNQANVFELMHYLTKNGGIMIHAVPTPKFGPSHGFYFYDETIFDDLAYTNNYQILEMYRQPDPYEIILVAFKKVNDGFFKMPIQGQYRT
jgi:cyclopropane fatty-acyl-phospholipid synthase-like methyltransferase